MAATGCLLGRLALVTGGASGIGRAICQAFAKEGAMVAAVDVDDSGLKHTVSSLEGNHGAFLADVSYPNSVTHLMDAVKEHFAQVPSIAINSAGITKDNFLLKMDEKSFDKVIRVNLKGTFLITQAISRAMVEESVSDGAIVNISSIIGKVGNLGQCNYAASKAGVEGLTKTAAKELAKFGIRCNAVLPGFIETPMTEAVPEKVIEKMKHLIALGRMGKASEIAEACVFLASPKSSYITGASLEVTGGMHM